MDKTLDLCQDSRVGLFDLDEYQAKKARADESAIPPREFPVAFAEVFFNGRKQTLRFQPVLFDGGHVFIGFRTLDSEEESTRQLIAGGGNMFWGESADLTEVPEALLVETERSFDSESWLGQAVKAIEHNHFGCMIIEVPEDKYDFYLYKFFGSTGAVKVEVYLTGTDGNRRPYRPENDIDYDPRPRHKYWANPQEAASLLLSLDADKFAQYLELQKADPSSVYGLSSRWQEMTFAQKHAMLPPIEREIERELLPLMRAVVWSDSSFSNGAPLQSARELQRPFWRRPRFWVETEADEIGDILALNERLTQRIGALWPHLHAHFAPLVTHKTDIHPAVSHWMRYRGAYIVEWQQPNAHEHLESRLLLRDFLAERGVSLDVLERGL